MHERFDKGETVTHSEAEETRKAVRAGLRQAVEQVCRPHLFAIVSPSLTLDLDCHWHWDARYVKHCCGTTGVTETWPSWTGAATCAHSAIQPRIEASRVREQHQDRDPGYNLRLVRLRSTSERGDLANRRQSARSDLLARWRSRHRKVDDCPDSCMSLSRNWKTWCLIFLLKR